MPKFNPNGDVEFTIEAPHARVVRVVPWGDGNGLASGAVDAVSGGAGGRWRATVVGAEPGFHYYHLEIDGQKVSDLASPPYFGWGQWTSGVDVPEPGVDFYAMRDVPHGHVRQVWYASKLTGRPRRVVVYTPPGYDADPQVRYPVLYLQHGAGENEFGWTNQGRANFILDNLIAEGTARPFIMVNDNGYAAAPGKTNASPVSRDNLWEDVLVGELVPLIDDEFRTNATRDGRCIAGLSMGAGQALRSGTKHSDTFSSIAAMSGGFGGFDPVASFGGAFADVATVNARLKLLWLGCGRGEGDRFTEAERMHVALDAAGVRHVWFPSDHGHEWQAWRKHLLDLAPRLFRQ